MTLSLLQNELLTSWQTFNPGNSGDDNERYR
jgi:hypothetical protein